MPFERKDRGILRYDKKDMIIIGYVRSLIDRSWEKRPLQYQTMSIWRSTLAGNINYLLLFLMVIHIY